jgi:hypothetical protein
LLVVDILHDQPEQEWIVLERLEQEYERLCTALPARSTAEKGPTEQR